MLTIRDAKPLFALSTLLIPWDFFVFGQGLGWGLHFPLVRFVQSGGEAQYLTVLQLFELTGLLGANATAAVVLWMVAGAITGLAGVYVLLARLLNGTTSRREDRIVGRVLMTTGALFVVSRFFVHDFLIVGGSSDVYWFSVPFGAAYTIFVGGVFYWDKFRMGA